MLTPEQEVAEASMAVRAYQREAFRLAIRVLEGRDCIDAPHHAPLCNALDEVIFGGIRRLLVSIPPGYGKTACAVWAFMARGLLLNPRARYLHLSYSSELALSNSTRVRDLLLSDHWRLLGGPAIRDESRAKGLWETVEGGTVRATAAGSAVTGFRAGRFDEGFTGAAVIDDANKPDDARSRKIMADTNGRYNTTIASRLAHEGVPIIVIQQRVARFADDEDPARTGDMSEFLLRGGSGEVWDHLELPAMIDNGREYPREWTHGRPIAHGLPDGPLWPEKLSAAECEQRRRANPYVWAAQYDQRPKLRAGDPMIEGEWFRRYIELPKLRTIELFADTANKTAARNDYTAVLVAGTDGLGNLYLLDMMRGKWAAPDLLRKTTAFWEAWRDKGATRINVEDAQSGTGLIQSLAEMIGRSVKGVTRTKDKFTRVNGVLERISAGRVFIPVSAPWVAEFVTECEDFTDDDSHANDDQVDTLVDAIETLIGTGRYNMAALL